MKAFERINLVCLLTRDGTRDLTCVMYSLDAPVH